MLELILYSMEYFKRSIYAHLTIKWSSSLMFSIYLLKIFKVTLNSYNLSRGLPRRLSMSFSRRSGLRSEEEQESPGSRSVFSDNLTSISNIKFVMNGGYILSRDFMTLKVYHYV